MSRLRAFVLIFGLACAGCTSWPPHGHDGMAETALVAQGRAPEADILRARAQCLKTRLDALEDWGAEFYRSAGLIRAETLWTRTMREIEGGMPRDALADLSVLEKHIDAIRETLPDVDPKPEGCRT